MSLKIISLIDAFSPEFVGGAARVFYETNRILAGQNHEVHTISRYQESPLQMDKESPGTANNKLIHHFYRDIPGSELKKLLHYRRQIRKLFREVSNTVSANLIILHSSSAAFGIKDLLQKTKIPIFYYFIHSPWHMEYQIIAGDSGGSRSLLSRGKTSLLAAVRKHHEASFLRISQGIITLSKSMQEEMLHQHACVDNKNRRIIPGGADFKVYRPVHNIDEKKQLRQKFRLGEDDFIIITSRRLVPRTGVDLLLQAFAGLSEQRTDNSASRLRLIVTGSGISAGSLQHLAAQLKITDQVIFTGHVPESSLAEYYRCSDLYVIPTKYLEGFGLSTVEAMASGLPVAGTAVGGTPEILSRVSSELLINRADVGSIQQKLESLLKRKDLPELAERSLQCARDNYSWNRHVTSLLEFLQQVQS